MTGIEAITWLSLHAPAGLPADLQKKNQRGRESGSCRCLDVREADAEDELCRGWRHARLVDAFLVSERKKDRRDRRKSRHQDQEQIRATWI